MLLLSYTYIGAYFFYVIFGYNCIHKYINNQPIDIVCFKPMSYSFFGKRMCMLSLIALLYSAYFLYNPTINYLLNTIFINTVVVTGYFIKWKLDEPTTFAMHVFWTIPVIVYADYDTINVYNWYENLNITNYNMLLFLCQYYFIQD